MAFTFKPGIYKGASLYELPRPIERLRLQDAWDFSQTKVPLAVGDDVAGVSRRGVDVSIEGQVGSQAGTLKTSEADMFAAIEELRDWLDADDPAATFWLFLYHDSDSAVYRYLKGCTTVRMDYDLSDKSLFTYSLLIHATDPVLYTSAPAE